MKPTTTIETQHSSLNVEVEKKFKLKTGQDSFLRDQLKNAGAEFISIDLEENILFKGNNLDNDFSVLRVRKLGNGTGMLTYKAKVPNSDSLVNDSGIKQQIENETFVENTEQTINILNALGYKPWLIYDKKRETWRLPEGEIVIDNLSFGLFAEIESTEENISIIEKILNIENFETEFKTYTKLSIENGIKTQENVILAKF